jgi:hypothetical protein
MGGGGGSTADDIAPKKGKVPELLQKFLILKNQKVSVGDPAVQVDVLLLERKEGGERFHYLLNSSSERRALPGRSPQHRSIVIMVCRLCFVLVSSTLCSVHSLLHCFGIVLPRLQFGFLGRV